MSVRPDWVRHDARSARSRSAATPQRLAYTGTGDVNDATNYAPFTPAPANDHYTWAGSSTSSG